MAKPQHGRSLGSWSLGGRDPGAALLPLRGFLGITFVYAGIQKLSDPGFLHKGAPSYLGNQLRGFANGTPGGFILKTFAIPHVTLAGAGIALAEIAIGLLVLIGLFTRGAAIAGLVINLLFLITASWKTYPYFLGSDIVFVFAWLPFALVGANGQPALEHVLARRARRPAPDAGDGRAAPAGAEAVTAEATRRELLGRAAGLTGAATLLLGGVSALAKGRYRSHTTSLSASTKAAPTGKSPAPAAPPSEPPLPSGAVRIGPASRLTADQAATYRDPGSGDPDLVIRHQNGTLTALSAVCTHAGCTVGYEGGQITCPCHGATYDPQTGAATGGPAQGPLAKRRVVEHGGSIYAIPS
ncbi:MAG: Rieske 2Fe-2S domain-containing protein [Actinomycetota bacterium]|nr:Rieske 2Fe-2S domain-containing protein [Actinomycetota bacterium]